MGARVTESVNVVGETPRLQLLDYLRFIAAVSVMCYHYLFHGINDGKIVGIGYGWAAPVAQYGYIGVELFFLISGFVIFGSAHGKTARRFVVGRFVRLYPAFWPAMLITAAVIAIWGRISGLSVTVPQVVANLTMVPSFLHIVSVDGVYWTLLLELEFYFAVFILLLLGLGNQLAGVLPWWIFAMFAVWLVAPQLAALPYLGNSFVLFGCGALISEIRRSGLNIIRTIALVVGAFLACAWSLKDNQGYATESGADYIRPVVVILMLCFLGALLSTCSDRVSRVQLPRAMLVGALTYPLYLIHAHIGFITLSNFAGRVPLWLLYPLVMGSVIGVAYLIHVLFERKPKAFWFSFFDATVGRSAGWLERSFGAIATLVGTHVAPHGGPAMAAVAKITEPRSPSDSSPMDLPLNSRESHTENSPVSPQARIRPPARWDH